MNIYTYICFLSAIAILLGFITSKISDRIQSTIAITASAMVGSLLLLFLGSFNLLNLDIVATETMISLSQNVKREIPIFKEP